jgi:hypothetical protein
MDEQTLMDFREAINEANSALNRAIGISLVESARRRSFALTDALRDIGIRLDDFINANLELFD